MSNSHFVAVNEAGRVIGEDHPGARLTDREVELIRELYDEFKKGGGIGPTEIARKFETTKRYVLSLVNFEKRGQSIDRHVRRAMTPD